MALRRDPMWVDLTEDDYDSDLEWYESDGVLDTLLAESWCVKREDPEEQQSDFGRKKVLQRLDEIEQELGAMQNVLRNYVEEK